MKNIIDVPGVGYWNNTVFCLSDGKIFGWKNLGHKYWSYMLSEEFETREDLERAAKLMAWR